MSQMTISTTTVRSLQASNTSASDLAAPALAAPENMRTHRFLLSNAKLHLVENLLGPRAAWKCRCGYKFGGFDNIDLLSEDNGCIAKCKDCLQP